MGNICFFNVVFLFPQGGRQVARSKSPPPAAAAVPPPAYRPQCVHQQDELQQPGHLRWAKPAEPSQGGPAPAGGHAGGDWEGTLHGPAGCSLPGPSGLGCSEVPGCPLSPTNAAGVAAWKSSPSAPAFCAEARVRSGKGCSTPLKPRLPCVQVKALVEFLTENCCGIFGEEMAGLSSPSAEESPAPMGRSAGMRRD